jgi:Raf kinase inhibitor-like YbhB/YbcL family protein
MKNKLIATGMVMLAVTIGAALAQDKGGKGGGGGKGKGPAVPGMALSSPDFQDGGIIPDKFTQAVPMPVSPELDWTNVPMGTMSFVLIMHDPDNALNKMPEDVLHWMAFNIPGSATKLAGGQSADAKLADGTIQAKNLRGAVGFMGPGNQAINPYHHYTFELFALDSMLTLGPDATRADVLKSMEMHIIGKAILVGRFKRPA